MSCVRFFSTILALLGISPAWAGAPTAIIGGSPTSFTSSAIGSPVTQTVTLTFDAHGTSGLLAELTSLSFSGASAKDFAIVGGTCEGVGAVLSASNTTCTVVVQYTPSSSGAHAAQLNGACTTVSTLGGFTLLCNGPGLVGALTSLTGSVLAALVTTQAPFLEPKLLTILCFLLLGIGGYFARRKRS